MFHRFNLVRRTTVAALTLALAATVATSTSASAEPIRPIPIGSMSPQELELYCAQQGGSFESEGFGRDSTCVLPNGVVIWCRYQKDACFVLNTAPKKRNSPAVDRGTITTKSRSTG